MSRKGDIDPRLVECIIGSELFTFLVDSGATVNTITSHIYESIQKKCKTAIQDLVMYPKDVLRGYASDKPLDVLCSFSTYIGINRSNQKRVMAKLFVVRGTKLSLLGYESACRLNILHISSLGDVNWIEQVLDKVNHLRHRW